MDHIFFDSRDPMIVFSDSRDPISFYRLDLPNPVFAEYSLKSRRQQIK